MNDENKKEKNTTDSWYAAEAEARKNAQEAPKSTAEYTQEDAQKAEQLRAETPWKTETFTPEPSWQDKEAQARQTAVDQQAETEAKAKAVADAAAKAKAEEDAIAEETAKAAQSHTTGKYDPTPGRWYADEAEGRAAELARSQGTWAGSEATNDSDDPYAMYGGGIEPVVFVAEGKKEEEPKEEPKEEGVKRETKMIEKLDPIKDPSLGALNIKPKEEETKEEPKEEPKEEDEITKWGKKISELEEHKKKLLEQDETAKKRGRSMKMIAGISDSLASLANLIGVGSYGSSHINTGDALTPLDKKLEAARLERKADIKSIDDRLDQYRNQMSKIRQHREDQAYQSAEAEKGRQFQAAENEKGRTYQSAEAQKTRDDANARFEKELKYKEGRDKVSDEQFTKKIEAMNADREVRKTEIANNYKLGLARLEQEAKEKGLKGSYPVLVGDNEILDIPKEKINNQTIGRIFDALPAKYKDLARGKEIYEYVNNGAYGQTKVGTGRYEQPSLNEMLAAIGAASKDDAKIQDELRKLAGTYKPPKPQQEPKNTKEEVKQTKQTPKQIPSWMRTSQQLWQNAINYNDPFAEFE